MGRIISGPSYRWAELLVGRVIGGPSCLFGMQIVDDEDATSDQFSMSVVGKPMTPLRPLFPAVSCFNDNHEHF